MKKFKRFKNIWTIGLILVGVLLLVFYIAKIFFPKFIVGVAETPNIVKFGNYVDSHKLAKHLFNVVSSLFTIFYFGACCRSYKFSWKGWLVIVGYIGLLRLVAEFGSTYYNHVNHGCLILVPFLICLFENKLSKETFISTAVCFVADIIAQVLSVLIRDLTPYVYNINTATFFILVIDLLIWRIMLFLFFNYKEKEE